MIISFANHKGGTGKTTSTINIGKVLADMNYKVLLVDMDPQANLTYSMGFESVTETVIDVLLHEKELHEIIQTSNEMDLIPAGESLNERADFLNRFPQAHLRLREALQNSTLNYDFVLIDCPPTLSIFTLNALNASDGVIIPMLLEVLSVQGLDQIIKEIYKIQNTTNPDLEIIGVLGVIVSESRNLSKEILEHVRDNYYLNVFNNYVRNNVRAAEAPEFGKPVIDYAPLSSSAKDYTASAKEFLSLISIN